MLVVGLARDLSLFVKVMLNIFINDGFLEKKKVKHLHAQIQEILLGN